ncbi:Shikimate kinase [Ensifer psoraleae]|uniref:shikimate kinase n=1 Tax=Sinorhizobium psoraleae TaxID=520838 RepID=UPI001FE9A41E|nr:shikimate kinase [Sinorhizobium psoraleae]NRP75567.1 Shikimate kinase [Sinorhizobium psoraleae]
MKGLLAEFESRRAEALLAASRGPTLEEKQEALDRILDAGSTVLEYHARLPPGARSILSNDQARRTRNLVLDAASECMQLATDGVRLLEMRGKARGVLDLILRSNPGPAQLSQAVSSVARHYVACVEFWEKKTWREERIQLAYAVTANLPNTKIEIQQAEEANLRLQSGSALISKFMVLQSRIDLAKLMIEPRASSLQAALKEMLIGEDGRVRLLHNLSAEVLPALHRTRDALQTKAGRPLEPADCSVLEGVRERLLEFSSALPDLLARLSNDRTGADLPLELLGQIAEGARIIADEVLRLFDLQPKVPPLSERPAASSIETDTTTEKAVTESAVVVEGTARRRKGKGKRKPAGGAGSSTVGRPAPQVAVEDSGTATEANVLSVGNRSSSPSVGTRGMPDAATRAAAAPGSDMAAPRGLPSVSSVGAPAREESSLSSESASRPGNQAAPRSQPEALASARQKTAGIGDAGSSRSHPQSNDAPGQGSQSTDSGVERMRSVSHRGMSSARIEPGAGEALGEEPAGSSIGLRGPLTASRRAAGGPRHGQSRQADAMARKEGSLRFGDRSWLGGQELSGESRPGAGPGRRRFDHVAAQSFKDARLNDALHDISFAHDINQFSCAVLDHDKRLQGQAHHATFLQKAASEFTRQFVPRWEQDVRARNTWGYATSCNAISREPGGRAGMEACRAMAAQVSRLGSALNDVESKTLSLLVLSFSRYPRLAECRDGTIRIANFFHKQRGALSELNGQNVALLVNGLSKWPEDCRGTIAAIAGEVCHRADRSMTGLSGFGPQQLAILVNGFSKLRAAECSRATIAIASELCHRADRPKAGLSGFDPQHLANLVNGFSKLRAAECSRAIDTIAGEVCDRADKKAGLSGFNSQHLANLVNGFSKERELGNSHQATVVVADEICRLADEKAGLSGFNSQALANLVNAFSKWPEDCHSAIVAIARQVPGSADQLPVFDPQALANLVNGFSKWPEDCRGATIAIAGEVCHRADHPKVGLSGFDPQHLANLVNGFSKLRAEECSRATLAIADEVCHRAERPEVGLSDFDAQHLVNLVNGFSKWPQEESFGRATNVVAGEVLRCAEQLRVLNPQHLANLVNGFSKWPQWKNSQQAAVAIAGEVLSRTGRLHGFEPQGLANLVNGFSKWPEDCRGAIVAIAKAVARSAGWLSGFNEQNLANLVNGFSKCPDEAGCGEAIVAIAGEVLGRASPGEALPGFNPQTMANLVNGFSKWPQEETSRQATAVIAGEVIRSADRRPDFTSQHLANLVNGLSKWPQEETSRQATAVIAGEVLRRAELLCEFHPQDLANLLNGFDRWPEEEACSQAVLEIGRRLGPAGQPFRHFTTPGLSSIANSLARGVMRSVDAGEIAEAALLKDRLHKLAHYLHYASDRLEGADAVGVANILKALAKARLYDDLGSLSGAGLNRLAELYRAPGFALENNLETMGNLCAALLPLARSPRKQLLWHRRQALNLLNDIQPIVEHKIEAVVRASDAERSRGPTSTRRPALSIYQVLKARANLAGLLRRPYVEGKKSDLRVRRDELQSKTKEILDSTRELIESDLSNMSWNLIAQIEAEGPIDALDTFVAQNAAMVQAQHSAAVFDAHQVLRAMDHEPRPPQGEAGLMRLPVVDMQGRQLATEPETRYSIFHRLTSGAVKMVAVQLPGKPSPFMLARTLTVDGVPYRMDLFGGSKLKPPQRTVSQVAARVPGRVEAEPSGGKLLAIPYAETAPGTAFEKLSRAWAPFKEAYYYTQRRGFAAPPALKDLGPHDYALEGAFKLSLLPDRPASEEHPFKLTGPEGPIALRPHDGCGFIKASLAKRMTAVRRAGGQEGSDRVPAFGEGRRSSLPAAALQHYPRSEPVANEVLEKAKTWLESRQGQRLTAEELFRTVTGGHIDGPGAVAVPSGDECLHLPTLKSETLTGANGVLIGRSPYDKPNLRPFAAGLVRSAVGGDPTAAFLDTCVAMQYSFNVAQKSGEELAADDPTFFAKGILIVVPDEMWPAAYADRGLVMSAEDVKCHSHWTTGKDRVKEDTPLDGLGILQATEVFAPGSLVAVPTGEQKKLDGDFDGDTVIIIGDRPQLYEHVREFDEKEQALGLPSLKPPKSHTPALDGDSYQFGRAAQILAATQDVLETYSGLQRNFLAQSHEARRWFAERAVFGTYEGIHHELRRDIGQLLSREEVSGQDIENMFARARRESEVAEHPVAREMAELLVTDLEAWAEGPELEHLTETVETANDAKGTTLSAAVSELLPDLADAYPATSRPRDRIRALIDNYPARIDPRPDGYNPGDLVQSANNLLSLGIKVGTDAYKSNTGARLFSKKSRGLQRLLHTTPGLRSVPYVKGLAASLNHGRFDASAALKDLEDNPTLTASVMQTSINLAVEQRILPEPSRLQPAAADSGETITLSPEEAAERARIEVARATKEEGKITTAALSVAASLRNMGIQVKMPHLERRLRSERSIREQLTGTSASSDSTQQLINSAVRHVFEIPDNDFTRAFKAAILAFEEQDYTEIEVTNWFKFERPTYLGIHTVLATTEGYRFQVEFHTPVSYSAKVDNHHVYKELQELKRRDALEKVERLEQKVREGCKGVNRPDDVLSIAHWRDGKRSTAPASGLRAVGRSTQPKIARSPEAREIVAALGERPIVLVGMPGAGKSTIGPVLARRLGLHFIDTDRKIEQKAGKSISEIFKDHGEDYFRRLEAREIAKSLEDGIAVIATGGGAVLNEQTRHLIGNKGLSIWFDTDLDVIQKRTRKDPKRPLLQGPDPDQKLARLMSERRPLYQQANLRFVPPHKTDRKNADPCLTALHAYLCLADADRSPSDAPLRDDIHSGPAFPTPSSDAQIGGVDPPASSNSPHGRTAERLRLRRLRRRRHAGAGSTPAPREAAKPRAAAPRHPRRRSPGAAKPAGEALICTPRNGTPSQSSLPEPWCLRRD